MIFAHAERKADSIADRILDAAVEAASIHGIGRMSVADVAKRAGLSRPTVYKRYPSKDALVAAAVSREAMRVVDGRPARRPPGSRTPRGAHRGGGDRAAAGREHPLLDRVVRTEPERLVPLLTTDDGPILGDPPRDRGGDRRPVPDPGHGDRRRVADMLPAC